MNFATIGNLFDTFLVANLILMAPPPTIAGSLRGRGASYGPALPDKQPVVYIEPLVLAVTIAQQNTSSTTYILRNETITLPCVLFYSNL